MTCRLVAVRSLKCVIVAVAIAGLPVMVPGYNSVFQSVV
jgi:hypothetical protein